MQTKTWHIAYKRGDDAPSLAILVDAPSLEDAGGKLLAAKPDVTWWAGSLATPDDMKPGKAVLR